MPRLVTGAEDGFLFIRYFDLTIEKTVNTVFFVCTYIIIKASD